MITFNEPRVVSLIRNEQERFPCAELRDYYKLFFQSLYGPGHFIESSGKAKKWIEQELTEAEISSNESHFTYEIGYNSDFCRVYLRAIIDGKVGIEDFHVAFLKSANEQRVFIYGEWYGFWQSVAAVIERLDIIAGESFARQKEWIEETVKEGNHVLSHSKTYREMYHPHYRVIRKAFLPETFQKAL
jgi:hypothetical protein